MKRISKLIVNCSMLLLAPVAANAAGTYYNGNYQSAQQRYTPQGYTQQQQGYYNQGSSGYSNTGYNRTAYQNPSYSAYQPVSQQNTRQQSTQQTQQKSSQPSTAKQGFYLNAGITRETAMWQFEMKEAGSLLHYDNISWNVFDVTGGYDFDLGNTSARIEGGLKIGMQAGESSMVDDDITNGGYFITQWVDGSNNVIGNQIGHALSVGTSEGGSMFGYNIGFGLTDFFAFGKAKITPSVGYRSFSYKLSTKQNFGMSIDTANCFTVDGSDEVQCDPAVIIHYPDGSQQILWRDSPDEEWAIGGTDPSAVDVGGTYYYKQPGSSHAYEVAWNGPYVALDMAYDINQYNAVNARVELGFPGYTAIGDQGYRFDWAHPKSIEDTAGMGSAIHLGLGANWNTSISDNVMLSIGLTYDYYSVSDVDVKTYLNSGYYMGIYNAILAEWIAASKTEADMLDPTNGDPIAKNIKDLESSCPGWVCSASAELESFYKSMGIRVGISARF